MADQIPETMLAVQLDEFNSPLTTRPVPVPRPGPGQVLVRIAVAPVNPTDLGTLRGSSQVPRPLPIIPGAEGSGTVVAAGAGLLPRWLLGKRVACAAAPPLGGTWAEYMVTAATRCTPLQKNVSLEQGAMLLVNPLTALAFLEMARKGKHAAVVNTAAASALGRMLLTVFGDAGIPLINIVRRPAQVQALRELGAAHVLDSSQPDFQGQLQTLVRELNATLIFDAIAGSMTNDLLVAAPHGSTIVVYARLSLEQIVLEPLPLLYREITITGFYLSNWTRQKGLLGALLLSRRAQRLLATQLQTPVRARLPLTAANEALELYTADMGAGKILFVPAGVTKSP